MAVGFSTPDGGADQGKDAQANSGGSVKARLGQDGLRIKRHFCPKGVNPFDQVVWEKRTASIKGNNGEVVFNQENAEVPSTWSQLATNVVASKYFYGEKESKEREKSVRDLIHRVTRTIADWAKEDGVFADDGDAEVFYDELTWLCLNQYGSFNSPVWFNVGLFHQNGIPGSEGNFHWDPQSKRPVRTLRGYEYPQGSACFIQSVQDTMEDIMRLAAAEAMLFKYGSGTGTDLSTLRSSREKLAGGGKPSGPLSFMRVFDQIAGVVKSGGKTRRAAKMQSLRVDHPDILEFIECKTNEEKKARALIDAGFDGNLDGDAYASVMYQNANLAIRVTDEFMQAAQDNAEWQTYAVTTGEPMLRHKASEMLQKIAEGTHLCGDPGVQYDSTINRWHTCPASGRINASNPCSEYMFLDDSACNLSSLNLMKFRRNDGHFDVDSFRRAVRIFIIAQETLVDHVSYPTEKICRNSHEFRALGLGYANLGAMLMSLGWPYDSDCGRNVAAALTAVMSAEAYATSAELAGRTGPFPEFPRNRQAMLKVMKMHREAVDGIALSSCTRDLVEAAKAGWDEALASGAGNGYRNAQTTLLAPTGTIGFMMDCDTTGVEPDIALVKYKLLAGGGMFKLVNRTVPLALERLGYDKDKVARILQYIEENDTLEGAPELKHDHLAVFDCAFRPAKGVRSIHYMGHLRMMAAVQPFLSGAISKTVNMPKESRVEDIRDAYVNGWKMGLKAVAIYRDGSKYSQPINLKKDAGKKEKEAAPAAAPVPVPRRTRMPATGMAVRHKFEINGHEGYLHVGLLENGVPGEIFVTMAKEGSIVGGMTDAFATAISLCLQYGVPLESLVRKFSHQRFEPNGMTTNRDIPFAKSIVDYIFRWLELEFLNEHRNPAKRPGRADASAPDGAGGAALPAAAEGVKDDTAPATDGAGSAGKEVGEVGAVDLSPLANPGGDHGSSAKAALAPRMSLAEERVARAAGAPMIERIDQQFSHFQEGAPACDVCGSITVRNGNCYKCYNCGSSLGCS